MNPSLTFLMLLSVVASAALFCAQEARAAVKYVATTGNDTWAGTEASPYRTINKGLQNIGSSGTLYIKGGTYVENINDTIPSGTSSTPTTITTYQSDLVIIRPSVAPQAAIRIGLNGARSYIVIKGANYSGSPRLVINLTDIPSREGISLKRSSSTYNGTNYHVSHHVTMENMEIIGGGRNGFNNGGGAIILGGDPTSGGVRDTYHTVRRVKVRDYGDTANRYDQGIYCGSSRNLIEYCETFNNGGAGIKVQVDQNIDDYNVVRFNKVHGNHSIGITLAGNYNEVYGNLIWNNGRLYDLVDQPNGRPSGIQMSSASNAKVYNNTIWNNYKTGGSGWGIIDYWDTTNGNNIIRNNIAYAHPTANYFNDTGDPADIVSNNLFGWASPGSNTKFQSLDPVNANFLKLASGATDAIDAGYNVGGAPYNVDLWGTTRPQGSAYDIGAHEVVASGGVPAAPSSLTATKAPSPNNYRQINLSWTNVASETGFKIERKRSWGETGFTQIATVGADVLTYNDSTCGDATIYHYRVRAYNASGNGSYSPEANATTDLLNAGLQGFWGFSEGTGSTTADTSGNANNGAVTGAAWVTGTKTYGLDFDGVDDVVNCGSGATLDALPAVTVAAWVKPDSMGEGSNGRIAVKGAGVAGGWQFMVTGTNQIHFHVDHATTNLKRYSASNAVSLGAWRHVVATWTGSATATNVKFYVNGVETTYGTTTNGSGSRVSDAAANFLIGNESGGTRTFDGSIDQVRVYNRVLTASEILAVYRNSQ